MSRERILIDTNVFISATLNPKGTPRMAVNLGIEKFDIAILNRLRVIKK